MVGLGAGPAGAGAGAVAGGALGGIALEGLMRDPGVLKNIYTAGQGAKSLAPAAEAALKALGPIGRGIKGAASSGFSGAF